MSILIRFKRLTLLSENCKYFTFSNSSKYAKQISPFSNHHTSYFRRSYGGVLQNFVPFEKILDDRRLQARRSVVVQVNSELSFNELHAYCSLFGNVLGIYHYKLINGQQHFMLVELEDENNANDLILSSCFSKQTDTIPVQSPFLWFRSAKDDKKGPRLKNASKMTSQPSDVSLACRNGTDALSDKAMVERLLNSKSLNEQIENLYEASRLSDLEIRLRFMVARQIEQALISLYPQVSVRPFGSSVNGFGKMGCDLDLLLKITSPEEITQSESRLVFHTKRSTVTGRIQQQRYMEIIGDIVQLFIPGCTQVRRILQARIPIIKYNQDYAGVECDLSMSSMSGVYMSELLYTFGCIDDRVRPLVFAVRKWAQSVGITNPSPGKWITNFPLTLMVIFYLQNANNGPILPSFNLLKKSAEKQDLRLTDDYVECTFLRDISKLNFHTTNEDSIEDLLKQFFSYYSSFNFHEYAISINQGKATNKPDHSSLYIVNPLENTLNVSKNVSSDECERLSMEFRNASWLLESQSKENKEYYWGLPLVFSQQGQLKNTPFKPAPTSQRLVSVKDLFVDDNPLNKSETNENATDVNINDLKNELEHLDNENQKSVNVVYKNQDVKKQVEDVRRHNIEELKKKQKVLLDSFLGSNNRIWVKRKTKR